MWSRKYEKCIKCGTTEIRHKGRGYCRHCHDKLRAKKPHRIALRRKISREWGRRNRENSDKHHEIWYEKNKDILCVLERGRYAKRTGKEVLQVYNRFIPMKTLKDPSLFKRVRDYIEKNQKKVGKRNTLIVTSI